MKKIMMFLLCGGLLVACSQSGYTSQVSNSDDVLISGSEVSITKQDYFETLLDRYGSDEVISEAFQIIAEKELTDKDAYNKALKEKEATYAKYADGDLAKYAKNLGYSSKEDYINQVLSMDVKIELLQKKYAKENLNDLIKTYQVVSFKKIIVDKESDALKIIEASKTKADFDKKLKEAGSNGEDAGIVTKNSTLDDNLKAKLKDLSAVTKDGVYSKAIKLSDDKYAVVYLYDTDHKNTDALVNKLISDDDIKKEITGKYLKKYKFDVADEKIKKAIQKLSSDYIE